MHPTDRERFKLLLRSMQDRTGGELRIEFRMRHADNSYRWFELEAAAVPSPTAATCAASGSCAR